MDTDKHLYHDLEGLTVVHRAPPLRTQQVDEWVGMPSDLKS